MISEVPSLFRTLRALSFRFTVALALGALAVTAVLTLSLTAHAGGDKAGNAGDGIAIEFYSDASAVSLYLSSDEGIQKFGGDVKSTDFAKVLASVVIESTDDDLTAPSATGGDLDAHKDALNFVGPPARVIVNRTRWNDLQRDDRIRLSFHEILGLLGIEPTGDYHLSAKLDVAAALKYSPSTGPGSPVMKGLPVLRLICSDTYKGTLTHWTYPSSGMDSFTPEHLVPGIQVIMGRAPYGLDSRSAWIASFAQRSAHLYRLSFTRISDDSTNDGQPTSDQFAFSGESTASFDYVTDANGLIAGMPKTVDFTYSVTKIADTNSFGSAPAADAPAIGSEFDYDYRCEVHQMALDSSQYDTVRLSPDRAVSLSTSMAAAGFPSGTDADKTTHEYGYIQCFHNDAHMGQAEWANCGLISTRPKFLDCDGTVPADAFTYNSDIDYSSPSVIRIDDKLSLAISLGLIENHFATNDDPPQYNQAGFVDCARSKGTGAVACTLLRRKPDAMSCQ